MDESFWESFQSWEQLTSEAWTHLIQAPEFITLMHQQLEGWLLCKQQLDRATEVTLRTAQLPTRREQDQTLRLIHQLQVQVELLADRVERVNATIRPS